MNRIILKITPVDHYFFGSENINPIKKVQPSTNENKNKEETNYYLKSTMLPQQSTVLGALRYALLLNSDKSIFENNKIVNKQNAEILIGKKSFDLEETIFDFGAIKGISHVFLIKGNEKYIPSPLIDPDHLFEMKSDLPFIQKYDAKAGYEKKYTHGKSIFREDDIFEKLVLTQNKKEKETDRDAFFKTQYYTLKNDWAFGIELDIDDERKLAKSFVMKMGGENRLFRFDKLDGIKAQESLDLYASPSHYTIALVSDAHIADYSTADFDFAILNTVPFRHLTSVVNETERYTHRSKTDNKELKQSKLIELIEKGAIFYFETENAMKNFETKIKKDYLQKAGFNHYITLSPIKN
jgi:CRISPR-associated protein Cmr3